MYDIVANGRNSFDVDKFDYIIVTPGLVVLVAISSLRDLTIHKLFYTRGDLHWTIYMHSKAMERMVVDASAKANDYLQIASYIDEPTQYWQLDDTIVKTNETSSCQELKESIDRILRIHRRELYKVYTERTSYSTISNTDMYTQKPNDQAKDVEGGKD